MKEITKNSILEEDEIDLRELFKIIWDKRLFIAIFTITVTILSIIYVFIKTPIYEVKSNVKLGFIGDELLDKQNNIKQRLNIIFKVNEPRLNDKDAKAWVSEISTNKNLETFIQIKTNGLSNKEALEKNKEVLEYIQNQNQIKINNYIRNINMSILETKKDLKYIDDIEIKDIQREIKKLRTQEIPAINDKITFLNDKITAINNKISFNKEKLIEYNKSINNLYKNTKKQNSSESMISSIQMVNYQNLILSTQNKIEDLEVEKNGIKTQTIPILEKEKENINKDTIKKLEEKINLTLGDKKISLQNKIKDLEYKISSDNINNAKVIGDYIIYDYPIKPKKKLTIVVAFVTGFILSIFLSFLLNFLSKKED